MIMPCFARVICTKVCLPVLAGAVLTSTATHAQVGHLPSKSPYEDLTRGQDFSLIFGQFNAKAGPAGILPKESIFGGIRYDVPVGGPASLTARYVMVPSERTVLIPGRPLRTRVLEVQNTTTHVADVGLSIALTGQKTWHRLVPSLALGTGLASDFTKADTGGYKFGTKFAFTGGANVRYVLRNNWAIRADATNYLWRNVYPDSYYLFASDTSRILTVETKKKSWSGTWAWSVGLVIPIFR